MKWTFSAALLMLMVVCVPFGILASQAAVAAKCPALAGNYVLQGEDGQVHISIKQDQCKTITITRDTGYLGKVTSEVHTYRVDGTTQPDSGWYGGDEKYQGTARFTPTSLRIELRANDGSTRTMLFSLTPRRDLIEDALTNGERLGGGPTVATRQK